MTSKLTASLREAPATVPALAALGLFVVWATDQAGYPVTHWAPGGLIVLALLAICLGLVRVRILEIPLPVRVALGAFTAYTALSFLSILWAAVPGDAWEGADRTLLYLLVFALFACWRQRGGSAALALCGWTLALVVLALLTAVHLDSAGSASLQSLLPGGRLTYPSGYANANAAQWLMAFWAAALLARSQRLPWALRGLLAGGAVLLAGLALLSQSRGSLYATPVMLVLVFALLPGRTRTFALLVPIGLGIAAAAPAVLKAGDLLAGGQVSATAVHRATIAIFLASAAVAAVVGAGAAVEARGSLSPAGRRRFARGLLASSLATLVAVLVVGLALAGDPVNRVKQGWDSFKGGYGANTASGARLVSGFGSNRYDFYRVALDEFLAHPIIGTGAENFQQQYLVHGRSEETPRYPHSVELRTLSETGAVGGALAVVGLAAALLAAGLALRRADPLAAGVAAAALAGFGYWLVHGSFDWFWEFAGLGAPAFAMLGLACSLAPRLAAAEAPETAEAPVALPARPVPGRPVAPPSRHRARARLLLAGSVIGAIAIAASLAGPWLGQLEVQSAAGVWTRAPRAAYARLDDAARLNPLSDEAYLVAGSIALRYGDLARADRQFSMALARSPGDAYATLERGAIASQRGERPAALALLERAARLNPRAALPRRALRLVRAGRRLSVEELNRSILTEAQHFA